MKSSLELKAESAPVTEITKVIEQCIPKTRSLLAKMEKIKMIEADKKSYESQVIILSNHISRLSSRVGVDQGKID